MIDLQKLALQNIVDQITAEVVDEELFSDFCYEYQEVRLTMRFSALWLTLRCRFDRQFWRNGSGTEVKISLDANLMCVLFFMQLRLLTLISGQVAVLNSCIKSRVRSYAYGLASR